MPGNLSFEDFIKWKLDPERPFQYHLDTSIELQSDYVIDLGGNIIVDYIGRYENLETDFAEICNRIGSPNIKLPHKRKAINRSKDYRMYYSDKLVDLISDHFKKDINIFSYTFE
jgi:hypothetical protein